MDNFRLRFRRNYYRDSLRRGLLCYILEYLHNYIQAKSFRCMFVRFQRILLVVLGMLIGIRQYMRVLEHLVGLLRDSLVRIRPIVDLLRIVGDTYKFYFLVLDSILCKLQVYIVVLVGMHRRFHHSLGLFHRSLGTKRSNRPPMAGDSSR